jgi:hypothetical protein
VVTDGGYGYGTGAVPAVRIVGGGGTGATAVAIVQGGVVVGINLVSGGSGYTSPPTVQIGAPQGLASTSIEVSSVDVRLHMTPGFIYQLQTSPDAQSWSDVGIPFLAVEASALQHSEPARCTSSSGWWKCRERFSTGSKATSPWTRSAHRVSERRPRAA